MGKFSTYKPFLLTVMLVGALVMGAISPAKAQWMEPKRLKFGFSEGFGGVHTWGKPSFDIHWWNTSLRLSPGLNYWSVGVTQKLAYFKAKQQREKILILSFYYHDDWLLANRRFAKEGIKKDLDVFMLMPGIHYRLGHRGYYYLEVSAGATYAYETQRATDGAFQHDKHHWLPMAEIRVGGIILRRKYYHQKFPMPEPKVRKIIGKKLKFPND